jgi:high-affinity nickel-transport protein
MRGRLFALYGSLVLFNALAWIWACTAFHRYPLLISVALLAYLLGLRHAVDADHIAAIDNVTRKLMQSGHRPVSVGLYFSLGHSTVVVLASVLLAATADAMQGRLHELRDVGGVVGTTVSALFLFAIALTNALILRSEYRVFRQDRSVAELHDDTDLPLASRGPLTRLYRPLFRLITRSRHMYPLGFLFGLGFDTATEIGVLGISATQAARGLPLWSILVFPVLFTAGMSLVDTLDSTLMVGAYGWARVNPVRKLYYNMTITGVSIVVAVAVGSVEVLGLLADRLSLAGSPWNLVQALNRNFAPIGYGIIGILIASWFVSVAIQRMAQRDSCETDR